MNKALIVIQFIYYLGLCLALLFAAISYFCGPVLARYAGYAALLAVGSCIAAIAAKIWETRRG